MMTKATMMMMMKLLSTCSCLSIVEQPPIPIISFHTRLDLVIMIIMMMIIIIIMKMEMIMQSMMKMVIMMSIRMKMIIDHGIIGNI